MRKKNVKYLFQLRALAAASRFFVFCSKCSWSDGYNFFVASHTNRMYAINSVQAHKHKATTTTHIYITCVPSLPSSSQREREKTSIHSITTIIPRRAMLFKCECTTIELFQSDAHTFCFQTKSCLTRPFIYSWSISIRFQLFRLPLSELEGSSMMTRHTRLEPSFHRQKIDKYINSFRPNCKRPKITGKWNEWNTPKKKKKYLKHRTATMWS